MHEDISRRAFEVFRAEVGAVPPMTLRGGDAVDRYDEPPPYDPAIDEPTDAYLEKCTHSGLAYLDTSSWRHYLPRLVDYALRHIHNRTPGAMAIDGLLSSLRPPDREPPRLGSLSPAQEAMVVAFLDALAFDENSVYQDFAMQVLEEYWVPHALHRERRPEEG